VAIYKPLDQETYNYIPKRDLKKRFREDSQRPMYLQEQYENQQQYYGTTSYSKSFSYGAQNSGLMSLNPSQLFPQSQRKTRLADAQIAELVEDSLQQQH